jgi:primosomal protein N' (replication factor Y)
MEKTSSMNNTSQRTKQSEAPQYRARDVALSRAKLNHPVCVLGSAIPSLESLFNAQSKKWHLNLLSNRIDDSVLPTVEVVDMHDENPRNTIYTALNTRVNDTLDEREHVLLFLDRRGYGTIVLCKQCNYLAQCPRFSLSLASRRDKFSMPCHLCGCEELLPERCSICGNMDRIQRGLGSEKMEQIAVEQFLMVRVARIDSDTITGKNSFKHALGDCSFSSTQAIGFDHQSIAARFEKHDQIVESSAACR